jgi:hypothetical protein
MKLKVIWSSCSIQSKAFKIVGLETFAIVAIRLRLTDPLATHLINDLAVLFDQVGVYLENIFEMSVEDPFYK